MWRLGSQLQAQATSQPPKVVASCFRRFVPFISEKSIYDISLIYAAPGIELRASISKRLSQKSRYYGIKTVYIAFHDRSQKLLLQVIKMFTLADLVIFFPL